MSLWKLARIALTVTLLATACSSPEERAERARGVTNYWRKMLDEQHEYAIPQRASVNGASKQGTPGQPRLDRVFDSTAIHSTFRFAGRIQSCGGYQWPKPLGRRRVPHQ